MHVFMHIWCMNSIKYEYESTAVSDKLQSICTHSAGSLMWLMHGFQYYVMYVHNAFM